VNAGLARLTAGLPTFETPLPWFWKGLAMTKKASRRDGFLFTPYLCQTTIDLRDDIVSE
jgi:hypothetical protein